MEGLIPEIPFFCIHLARAKEREDFMIHFQNVVGRSVFVWPASDENDVGHMPRKHPHEMETKIGELACLLSHVRLLEKMVADETPVMGIFEDDAEAVISLLYIKEFVEEVDPNWDILFLGANQWVDFSNKTPKLVSVIRFWGTHAFLIRLEAAKKVLATYKNLIEKGFAYPADWLYAKSIRDHGLVAYGPTNPKEYIRQKPGLVSAITGNVRI
jgi:GR25 family glycosyltransferase involved in LPS biosynthesis